jgi:putative pyoverdin transport system ATP-binding/permease protein
MLSVIRFPFRFLRSRRARWVVAVVIGIGALGGLANTAIVSVINQMLAQTDAPSSRSIGLFLGLCLFVPVSRYLSTMLLVRLTENAVYEARKAMAREILAAPLRQLESLGSHRLLATVTEDVRAISESLAVFPTLCLNLAILAGAILYLGWLSGSALIVFLLFLVFGIITYQIPLQRALHHLRISRAAWDGLVQKVQGLTFGIKELKLSRRRREDFLQQGLEKVAGEFRTANLSGQKIATMAHSWGQILFFLAIGVLVIVVPRFREIPPQALVGYTLTILYLAAPLETILGLMPMFARATAAVDSVQSLGLELDPSAGSTEASADDSRATWRELRLTEVTHAYNHGRKDPGDDFSVGPISLTFRPGEIVFLVGGNGSGKTTLAKLLLGLYEPTSGEICLDGRTVSAETREAYRQSFSAVFSDFFLFAELYGIEAEQLDERALEYLRRLQLDHKVEVRNGALSTIELSQGQRKRLALLSAYLEDRPILVFDEWAADQDPYFKQVFYTHLLPELRRRNKGVIAITHDDHYYRVADRIVKLDGGRVEFDGSVEEYLARPPAWPERELQNLAVQV